MDKQQQEKLIAAAKQAIATYEAAGNVSPEPQYLTLFRVALASLEAPPAVYEAEMNGFMSSVTKSHYEECKRYGVKTRVLYTAPPAPVVNRNALRELVDLVWQEATESDAVPSTSWADSLIDKVLSLPPEPVSSRYETPAPVVKAEPVGKVDACNCTWFITNGVDMKPPVDSLLYAAPPAPVVKVPDEIADGWPNDPLYVNGWNACRAEVLRLNATSAPATDNTEAQYESLKRGKTS